MLYKKILTPKISIAMILLFALAFSAMRAVGMLGPATLRWLLPLGFCVMAVLPWLLLTAQGRRAIGFRRASRASQYLQGAVCGMAAALVVFGVGYLLFGTTEDNWYVSISHYYKRTMDTSAMSFWLLHAIFTIPAIIFSPIGEEIFFRGLLPKTLEQKLPAATSTAIECTLFGLVHLVHHGIFMAATGLYFLPLSGAIWVAQMILVALMFAWLRHKTGSLLVSILAHSVFNLTMNMTIFLFLW